jgi:hypothetical protein
MKNIKLILIIVFLVIIMALTFLSLASWIKDNYRLERINFCGQTMCEANNPSSWHDEVYSPEGCDLSKHKITR